MMIGENKKKMIPCSVLVLIICVTGWLYVSGRDGEHVMQWTERQMEIDLSAASEEVDLQEKSLTEGQMEQTAEDAVSGTYFIYVCGAVHSPGVYELPADGRIYMAVEAAGGLAVEADARAVNLAAPLIDGSQIYIPTIGEEEVSVVGESVGTDSCEVSVDGRLNLNTATKAQLMELPGIGEAKAEAILQYREQVGSFSSIEEIMQVSGIKNGLFEQIKLHIIV